MTPADFLAAVACPGRRPPYEIPDVGRDDLACWFAEWGYQTGAEIGVERGHYAKVLLGANPSLALWCVDPWQAYRGYREHVSQEKLDGFFTETQQRLAAYPNVRYVRRPSVEAAAQIPDRSLDFVYIDANHELSHVIADLTAWVPKVRAGGIVAGHDYCQRKQSGYRGHVVEAVRAYTEAWRIAPWYVLGTKEVTEGRVRDRSRSFVWVV